MAITSTQTEHQVRNFAVGRHINSSAEAAFTINCGFKPRYVRVVNLTDKIEGEFFEGMTDDYMLKTVANGTRTHESSNGITITTNGFTMAADSSVNGNNKQISWVAVG